MFHPTLTDSAYYLDLLGDKWDRVYAWFQGLF